MDADDADDADELADKMADAYQWAILWDEWDGPRPEGLLPYARALIEAEKALDAAALRLRLAAGCIQMDKTRDACHAHADSADEALASLRSLLEKAK